MPHALTHCRLYLTQAQCRRLLGLLERAGRKADAGLARKLRDELAAAEAGDADLASWQERKARGEVVGPYQRAR